MKITIVVGYTLEEAKAQYRTHFGYPKKHKVTKLDLASWFGNLIDGDLDSVQEDESET